MASTMIAVGLTIAAAGFAGRYAVQAMKHMEPQVKQAVQSLPKSAFSRYYRGGFEPKMSKREASLILGVSPTANKSKIRDAHRKIMVLNHPDRGTVDPLILRPKLMKLKIYLTIMPRNKEDSI
ncbi:mitochondrial import inner membrane translocase subunit TIM14-like isoform X1 [Huso huso]|uniref:Mitochondrial import inner membrane translocase subunit TIM14 n=1 Tax=Huso huso TaxID=61971 RepID=A0ABR0ZGL1_HUSHU